ncbi:MAG: pyridoxal-phosphate-dependent aminotransferase family protein [Thermoplasmata archaeon]
MAHKRLLIPGPTDVLPEVLLQQTKPMIGHRSDEYTKLYTGIIEKLQKYFNTKRNITVLTASGTIWMDITGRNMVKKKALACVNGAFSERMYLTIKDCGKDVDALVVDWGKAIKPQMVLERLASGNYDTLAFCQNETSTGVRSPANEICNAVKKEHPEIMIVVDTVSSAGGDLIEPDVMNADIIFTSTQKCFALPPGLSIGIVSDAALERAKQVPGRGHYTDLIAIFDYYAKKKQNPTTPNISLMYALDYQLDRMLAETAQKRYERHLAMAEMTRKWATEHGIEIFPEHGYESITVSTLKNNLNKNIGELNKALGKRGYQISNGYGALKDKTFRIGHMGDWTPDEIRALLLNIEDIWGL